MAQHLIPASLPLTMDTHSMTNCYAFLCLVAFALPILGQGDKATPTVTAPLDAEGWLKAIDQRVYTPPTLSALGFTFRPQFSSAEGAAPRKAPFLVRYRWRAKLGDRVDFLGHEMKRLERLPGYTPAQFQKLTEDFRQVARGMNSLVQGRSFTAQYRGWKGRVVTRRVNGLPEVRLVLEPKTRKMTRRVVLFIHRDGLPWKKEKAMHTGDKFTVLYDWDERKVGQVLLKLQSLHTPSDPTQPAFDTAFVLSWQSAQGILVPASIEKLGKNLPAFVRGKTELLDMKLNDAVQEFVPLPEAKQPLTPGRAPKK